MGVSNNMETNNQKANTVQDTIERYVYQVTRRLPQKSRSDIEAELRGLIEDMLEARCGDITPTKKDIDIVLMELGSPAEFAARYTTSEKGARYLIGPELFPQYLMVLKIVLLAVGLGMTIVSFIKIGTNPESLNGFQLFAEWLGNTLSGLFSAATFVTLLFAIFEWRGINVGSFNENWLGDLPPVPQKKSRFSPAECIVGIVFSMLFFLLIVTAPQVIAIYTADTVIPVFDMSVFSTFLPFIACSCLLGVIAEVLKLLEGRHTMRLAIALTAIDVVSVILCVIVFTQPIWNESMFVMLQGAVGTIEGLPFLNNFWNVFRNVFMWIVIAGFSIDLITLWYYTLTDK